MKYRVELNTKSQLFTVEDKNKHVFADGKTIEEAVKKDMNAKEISGKEINVYINADQKAAYYTVDGEGADNYRIDLTSL